MTSGIRKRSVVLDGHKTSVSVEDAFWRGLQEMAAERNLPVNDIVSEIDNSRGVDNLSRAIRLAVFDHYRVRGGA